MLEIMKLDLAISCTFPLMLVGIFQNMGGFDMYYTVYS